MKNYLIAMTLPLWMAGCAQTNIRDALTGAVSSLLPQSQRITHERIAADVQTMDRLQQRLRALNEAGVHQNNYSLAKAQCWLDTAKTQYHENDRTGYIEASLLESQKILLDLEANKNAKSGDETPLVARSTRLRDDLWLELAKLKSNASQLSCTGKTVACAEVRLVRAGHAEQQTGWRAATPHVMMAEDAVRLAKQQAAACTVAAPAPATAPVAAPAAVVAPAPVVVTPPVITVPVIKEPTKEIFQLTTDALFAFDKSGSNDLLPGGLDRLAEIAARIKSYSSISKIVVVGHADRLGTVAYNDTLSYRRAAAVLSHLEGLGVNPRHKEAIGRGSREPVTRNCVGTQQTPALVSCLQADRRVTIEITGIAK
jgi:OmpA-OmpF porin, OOP family